MDFLNLNEVNHVTCCLISSGNFFPQYRTMPYHTINGNAVLQKIFKLVLSLVSCVSCNEKRSNFELFVTNTYI